MRTHHPYPRGFAWLTVCWLTACQSIKLNGVGIETVRACQTSCQSISEVMSETTGSWLNLVCAPYSNSPFLLIISYRGGGYFPTILVTYQVCFPDYVRVSLPYKACQMSRTLFPRLKYFPDCNISQTVIFPRLWYNLPSLFPRLCEGESSI